MNKNTIAVIFTLIVILVIGGIISAVRKTAVESKVLEPFAQCLNDSGAKFYGAYWCPHCNQQKSLFGRAHKSLPYVECSTPDGKGQTEVCTEEGIESYPTWKFADGTTSNGVTSLEVLAEKTGCELPGEEAVVEEVKVTVAEEVVAEAPTEIEPFVPELE